MGEGMSCGCRQEYLWKLAYISLSQKTIDIKFSRQPGVFSIYWWALYLHFVSCWYKKMDCSQLRRNFIKKSLIALNLKICLFIIRIILGLLFLRNSRQREIRENWNRSYPFITFTFKMEISICRGIFTLHLKGTWTFRHIYI